MNQESSSMNPKIEQGAELLKAERASHEARGRTLSALLASRPQPRRSWLLPVAATALTGVIGVSLIALPKPSIAAELQSAIQKSKRIQTYRALSYVGNKEGKEMLLFSYTHSGKGWKVIPAPEAKFSMDYDPLEAVGFDGSRMTVHRKKGYASVQTVKSETENDWTPQIDHWLRSVNASDLKVERGVRVNGRRYDLYTYTETGPASSSKESIYVDPASGCVEEAISVDSSDGTRSRVDFVYDGVSAQDAQLTLPSGTRIYDLDEQKEKMDEWMQGDLGTAHAGEAKVRLNAVFVDESGTAIAVTSSAGGAGLYMPPKPNRSGQKPTQTPAGKPLFNSLEIASEKYRDWGLHFMMCYIGDYVKDPSAFTLYVPENVVSGDGFTRHVATFEVNDPIRISNYREFFRIAGDQFYIDPAYKLATPKYP